MARLLSLVASRKVLAWRLSNTPVGDPCLEALEEALARFGPPSIMNTDQGSQFTSWAWTNRLRDAGVKITLDRKCHRPRRAGTA